MEDTLSCFADENQVIQFENWQVIVEEVYTKMLSGGSSDDSLECHLPIIQ